MPRCWILATAKSTVPWELLSSISEQWPSVGVSVAEHLNRPPGRAERLQPPTMQAFIWGTAESSASEQELLVRSWEACWLWELTSLQLSRALQADAWPPRLVVPGGWAAGALENGIILCGSWALPALRHSSLFCGEARNFSWVYSHVFMLPSQQQ